MSQLILALIPLGRWSGGAHNQYEKRWRYLYKFSSPLIGIIFGLLFNVTGWPLMLFAMAGWLSEKFSPARDSLGDITDGVGNTQDYVNLAERGVLGAMPYLFLAPLADTYLMLAFVVSWPLSAFIGTLLPNRERHLPRTKLKHHFQYDAWEWSEILRYFLVGVIIW